MKYFPLFILALTTCIISAQRKKYTGIQHELNPPMRVLGTPAPSANIPEGPFQTHAGFVIVDSLEKLRETLKKDNQKIRLKPGVYTAKTKEEPINGLHSIFAVTGSNNYFDLRNTVILTPVSLQSKLPQKSHISDSWQIIGDNNTFDGGYFKNEVDLEYPDYRVVDNEFDVRGEGNTFKNCTFLNRGSVPYGYTDFYGKGSTRFGRLDKHSCMSLENAKNTKLIGCKIYMQSYGHALHLHAAEGVHIEDCLFSGVLRPTNDIFHETVGRAKEYDFHMKYRSHQPIPKDVVIPLSEDGIRTYGEDKDITIINTTVERMRGNLQIFADGDIILKNVIVREAGDFGLDVSAFPPGKVTATGIRVDNTYRPAFYLRRGPIPENSNYEVTIMGHPTKRLKSKYYDLGFICGKNCTFSLKKGPGKLLPKEANILQCGDEKRPLTDSSIINRTNAKIILSKYTENCKVESVGPVEDKGKNNTIIKLLR